MERLWLKHYDPGVPRHLDYPHLPLYHLLDDSAARDPDRPCTSFFGRRLSYRLLKDASDRFAAALQRLGVLPGDRVGLLLPNSPQFIIGYYGALKAGAVVVALNPLANRGELTFQLCHAEIATLITIPLFASAAIAQRACTPLRHIICARLADWMPLPLNVAMGLRERWQVYQARRSSDTPMLNFTTLIAAPPPPDWQPARVDADAVAVLLYSGGTTGAAKGVMLSHFACMANAHQIRAWGQLRESDRILAVLPRRL